MGRRRRFGAAFKAKVALEAIKGLRTINEIGAEYEVHPNQVTKWKKQVLEDLPNIFSSGRAKRDITDEAAKNRLYEEIGRLKVELDWLKKKTGHEY